MVRFAGVLGGVCVAVLVLASSAFAGFGLSGFEVQALNRDGSVDAQAGSHPYKLVTNIVLNGSEEYEEQRFRPFGDGWKDAEVMMPGGLMGNPNATPRCTPESFIRRSCPNDTAVGVATTSIASPTGRRIPEGFPEEGKIINQLIRISDPVYNIEPPAGSVAEFGFLAKEVEPTLIQAGLRTGGDYGITVHVHNIPQAVVVQSTKVVIWGVPGEASHDPIRGTCLAEAENFSSEELEGEPPHNEEESKCAAPGALGGLPVRPLLTLPSSCGGPLSATGSVDDWEDPGVFYSLTSGLPPVTGCEDLSFDPSLSVAPEETSGSTATGVDVDVHLPTVEAPEGLAEANLHKAVVTLPQGVVLNPGAANGLQACNEEQFGLHNANPVECPAAAKVGTVEAVGPALRTPLQGSLYVAQQSANPFGSLVALYLVVQGEGVLIKQAGEVALNPVTGQLTTTFSEIPQQPVSDIKLHLFGGPRGALVTPPGCGSYTTTGQLTPFSSSSAVEVSSAFQISSGVGGSPCPASQPFTPGFVSGMSNNQAGAFSPFVTSFSRQDGEQTLGGVTGTAPPGLLGMLSRVSLCGEPQAAQGTCPASSLIGHVTVAAGAGQDPVSVSGQVFITGPYNGGPFGLSIAVPAVAGPFNLGTVVVRAAIHVDPTTGQITVASDPLPSILQGIPLQIKTVNVSVDREGFMFNPTNCNPLAVTGTLTSTQGASANVSSRFQAANCAALPFKPSFTVSTQAKTSKQNGASLTVKTTYPSGAQANIHSVAVVLPKQLPARLTTIQQACTETAFAQNPATCPTGSMTGMATATTPIFANPLIGPAYLVSHGGAAFPDVVVVLQGENITLDLVGSIDIKHGVTSSTFASVPDAPISSFQLSLPEGPHSGLAAVVPAKAKGSLCGQSLSMPFTITGQNGAVLKETPKITVTGCPKAKKKSRAKPTHRARAKKQGKKGK
jgi:hypothetical protein